MVDDAEESGQGIPTSFVGKMSPLAAQALKLLKHQPADNKAHNSGGRKRKSHDSTTKKAKRANQVACHYFKCICCPNETWLLVNVALGLTLPPDRLVKPFLDGHHGGAIALPADFDDHENFFYNPTRELNDDVRTKLRRHGLTDGETYRYMIALGLKDYVPTNALVTKPKNTEFFPKLKGVMKGLDPYVRLRASHIFFIISLWAQTDNHRRLVEWGEGKYDWLYGRECPSMKEMVVDALRDFRACILEGNAKKIRSLYSTLTSLNTRSSIISGLPDFYGRDEAVAITTRIVNATIEAVQVVLPDDLTAAALLPGDDTGEFAQDEMLLLSVHTALYKTVMATEPIFDKAIPSLGVVEKAITELSASADSGSNYFELSWRDALRLLKSAELNFPVLNEDQSANAEELYNLYVVRRKQDEESGPACAEGFPDKAWKKLVAEKTQPHKTTTGIVVNRLAECFAWQVMQKVRQIALFRVRNVDITPSEDASRYDEFGRRLVLSDEG